ncbi:MAG: acetylglutamate kinase [Ilumatobacteraceae bacterium]
MKISPNTRAAVLSEALPYLQRFAGKVIVVKYGGNALADSTEDSMAVFARDIALLHAVGMKPVVVHGGGPQITAMMERLGKESTFHNGLRVTDAETIEIVSMVLLGSVNPMFVSLINQSGASAAGVSGADVGLFQCVQRDPALGYVGDIISVNPMAVQGLLDDGVVPVVATLGTDAAGQSYNINADTAASALAVALKAEKILFLTDIAGVLRDPSDAESLIATLTPSQVSTLTADGVISGGMIPKLDSCLHAVDGGVSAAHILDGRVAHVTLLELLTDTGVGTMVVADEVAV